ncbi:MAG: Triosephosphate isomerase, partial [Acidobacteriaceae bacterium]|nr:Triosephosphate isomerase [Acidobacteriaceae bacterium]
MRIPLLAANWKMYKTPAEARSFVVTFLETALPAKAEVAIFPPA